MDPVDVAIAVSIVTVVAGGMTILGVTAVALLKKWTRPRPELPATDVTRLSDAVEQLAGEVSELHERLDFAERVLASQRDGSRLEEGRRGPT
jgi:hypothetical protein